MKLNIRSQLVLAFAVVLGQVLISSGVVFWKAAGVSQKLDQIKETQVPLLLSANMVDLDLMKARSDLRRVLLFVSDGKPDQAKAYKQKVQEDWNQINAAFAPLPEMSKRFVLQENKDRVAKLAAELPGLHQEQIDIAEAAGRGAETYRTH